MCTFASQKKNPLNCIKWASQLFAYRFNKFTAFVCSAQSIVIDATRCFFYDSPSNNEIYIFVGGNWTSSILKCADPFRNNTVRTESPCDCLSPCTGTHTYVHISAEVSNDIHPFWLIIGRNFVIWTIFADGRIWLPANEVKFNRNYFQRNKNCWLNQNIYYIQRGAASAKKNNNPINENVPVEWAPRFCDTFIKWLVHSSCVVLDLCITSICLSLRCFALLCFDSIITWKEKKPTQLMEKYAQ